MPLNDIETLFKQLDDSISAQQFIKLTFSDRRDKSNNLKNVFVKPVMLKSGYMLSFVYRHPTKDITKNYEVPTLILVTFLAPFRAFVSRQKLPNIGEELDRRGFREGTENSLVDIN